jgi:hypothetical protein
MASRPGERLHYPGDREIGPRRHVVPNRPTPPRWIESKMEGVMLRGCSPPASIASYHAVFFEDLEQRLEAEKQGTDGRGHRCVEISAARSGGSMQGS